LSVTTPLSSPSTAEKVRGVPRPRSDLDLAAEGRAGTYLEVGDAELATPVVVAARKMEEQVGNAAQAALRELLRTPRPDPRNLPEAARDRRFGEGGIAQRRQLGERARNSGALLRLGERLGEQRLDTVEPLLHVRRYARTRAAASATFFSSSGSRWMYLKPSCAAKPRGLATASSAS
jgi:hypothetical protein